MTKEPDFANSNVAIWGLGLMGGSLAMALSGKCASLVGIDPDPQIVELAVASQAFTCVANTPQDVIADADLIVLAAPVRAILKQIAALPRLHPNPCVVLDLGSTKRQILDAMLALPARFEPIGGHPMCGNEHSSFQHADADLFVGAPFALVTLSHSSAKGRALAETCVKISGAQPLWMDAETHDQWTALTSHLPYVIANALTASIPADTSTLAGPGLRSSTRLAASSPAMMLDVLLTNRDFLLDALQIFRTNLDRLENDIRRENDTVLAENLQKTYNARTALFAKGKA